MMAAERRQKKLPNVLVICINIVLCICLFCAFLGYDSDHQKRLFAQNLDDISNINQASANITAAFFTEREAKLRDVALYIEQNGLSLRESLDYIESSNSDDSKAFELIGADLTGFLITKNESGDYIPLNYSSGYGGMGAVLQQSAAQSDSQIVGFMPEFTDAHTAMRSFAMYNCVHVRGQNGEPEPFTLMVVSRTADFIDRIRIESDYDELSSVIMNASGDYLISDNAFKSTNFFQYLSLFNELSLDEQRGIADTFKQSGRGSLAFQDSRGRDNVFVYAQVPGKDWFCVTAVPISGFRNVGYEFSFGVLVAAIMLLLLLVDVLYFLLLNRRLRVSAENERIAGAAKTDFLSRMSHDMRTPMNGIIGMTRLTQDIPGLPAEVQSNLAAISDSSAYLLQLINDTLDMNKIESKKIVLNPEPVSMKQLAEHLLDTIRPMADQKQIRLDFIPIGVGAGFVSCDRLRVQQIFLNILSNAIKFTPQNGVIRIELETLKRENGMDYDRISVEDNGCGMSPEFLQHIFEPFEQEHTRIVSGQEGTGLGMAIVKNLVEMMDGRIEIASKQGAGTKVTVFLHFAATEPQTGAEAEAQTADFALLAGKCVLLAEDHPLNATIAERLLQKKGMLVEHAENGVQVLEMFSGSAPGHFDLVLMDIRMPEMDGLEAARRLRALPRADAASVPILAMTANAYVEDVQAALAVGMNAHLAKPIEPELLYQTLVQHLKA